MNRKEQTMTRKEQALARQKRQLAFDLLPEAAYLPLNKRIITLPNLTLLPPHYRPTANPRNSCISPPGGPWLDICAMYFLSLPAEIRFEIYDQLLVQDLPIEWDWSRRSTSNLLPRIFNENKTQTPHPAILRTNRQINREAVTFLYSKNRFVFASIPAFDDTLEDPSTKIPLIASTYRGQQRPSAAYLH